MGLKPSPANWFELLVTRDDLAAALDILACSSRVELEAHGEPCRPLIGSDARELLDELDALERKYARFWPAPRTHTASERCEPRMLLERSLGCLRDWAGRAADTVDRLRELEREREDLRLVEDLLGSAGDRLPDIERLTAAGPMLEARLYLLEPGERPEALPASVLTERFTTDEHTFLLAVGVEDDIEALDRHLEMQKARVVRLPPDLPAGADEARATVRGRIDDVGGRLHRASEEIDALNDELDVAGAIADAGFVRWYVDTVPDLASTENFAWIRGWTSFPDEDALLAELAGADVKGLIRLSQPPPELDPPLLLNNPRWMRPFEIFTGMLGVPGAGEADPTRIVAIAAPLMFGYMFGDVGHGAVLLAAGLILGRRYPALRLLVAGGLVAIVFGFLYGSVFAIETLIEPLWLHPLEHPILMMFLPLVGGALLLLTGMMLDALQSYWRQQGRHWWETGAGLVLTYLGLLGAFVEPRLLFVAVAGAAWFILGHALIAPRQKLAAVGAALSEFLETLFQILVNTLSFVRVGAFALAHSGLSLAVVGVAEAPSSLAGKLIVLVLGNALIIVLEGLIVGIQTTRLVLFEFFVRFLRAEGRPFRPILPHRDQRREV